MKKFIEDNKKTIPMKLAGFASGKKFESVIKVSDLEAFMEGKVVLPREASAEMISAFIIAQADALRAEHGKGTSTIPANAKAFQEAYKTMIATQEGE